MAPVPNDVIAPGLLLNAPLTQLLPESCTAREGMAEDTGVRTPARVPRGNPSPTLVQVLGNKMLENLSGDLRTGWHLSELLKHRSGFLRAPGCPGQVGPNRLKDRNGTARMPEDFLEHSPSQQRLLWSGKLAGWGQKRDRRVTGWARKGGRPLACAGPGIGDLAGARDMRGS